LKPEPSRHSPSLDLISDHEMRAMVNSAKIPSIGLHEIVDSPSARRFLTDEVLSATLWIAHGASSTTTGFPATHPVLTIGSPFSHSFLSSRRVPDPGATLASIHAIQNSAAPNPRGRFPERRIAVGRSRRLLLHFIFVLSRQSPSPQTLHFVLLAIPAARLPLRLFSASLAGIQFHQEEFFILLHANGVVPTVSSCDALFVFYSLVSDAAPHGIAAADLDSAAPSGRLLLFSEKGADFCVPIPTKSIIFSVRDSRRVLELMLRGSPCKSPVIGHEVWAGHIASLKFVYPQ
jgi:hypothetical protein